MWDNYPLGGHLIRLKCQTIYDVAQNIDKSSIDLTPDCRHDNFGSKRIDQIDSLDKRIHLLMFYLA